MSKNNIDKKIILGEEFIPKQWYNIQADLPKSLPGHYNTRESRLATVDDFSMLFSKAAATQEFSKERFIDIPQEVREIYKIWRTTPLVRATGLEKALGVKSKIYFKNESVSPSGSHKSNSAVAQAFYNKSEGITRITSETGAGQWGSALSMACKEFDLECMVYMVKISFMQKPYRKSLMEVFGAKVVASPSELTKTGREILAKTPDTTGSLGDAIAEAIEDTLTHKNSKYSLGSVLNHVLMHQTVIGLEAKKQMEAVDAYPDIVIGCLGGGSNFAGVAFPFLMDKLQKSTPLRAIAVEPSACPKLTKGEYTYDFGDSTGLTPALKMHTLGHNFTPQGIHAGGLRYHGASPLVSLLVDEKVVEARAVAQKEVFEAALLFARSEGILPAPESAHAIKVAMEEALKAERDGTPKTILFNLSGHGHFDLSAYDNYLKGNISDCDYSQEEVNRNLKSLPKINT
ncbi:MAG: TrpB-like pyridoxal phosphate-dependent enzyme [Elusimicrobia bacterium]|nr:TrpB-like pyridoxal phosphate-dependent enzyme [Elusimicrobiota bacterium]